MVDVWTENIAGHLPTENFEGMTITLVAAEWEMPPRYELGNLDDFVGEAAGDTES